MAKVANRTASECKRIHINAVLITRRSQSTSARPLEPRHNLSTRDSKYLDLSKLSKREDQAAEDFVLYPDFFDSHAQSILLKAALEKLRYSLTSPDDRNKRKEWARMLRQSKPMRRGQMKEANAPFDGEDGYHFREAHFDGVISGYREVFRRKIFPPNA